jgi:glyoxylase-like metal-dependent hydrolase (beta-lactamase superfamily II)
MIAAIPRFRLTILLASVVIFLTAGKSAASVNRIGDNLYAYISENDASSNVTFLITPEGILVVDTGVNAEEGGKLLAEIRKLSELPVRWIVNTHYHLDHRGGNAVVGKDAFIVSSDFTRKKILQGETQGSATQAATYTQDETIGVRQSITLHLGGRELQIYNAGPAHTMGDLVVYFPQERVLATGDLFLTNSCPAMDQGNMDNWIAALDHMLSLPVDHVVPGHFSLATTVELARFRDYLRDLRQQVSQFYRAGKSVAAVKRQIRMEKYRDFRQYPQYEATFADNAAAYYRQLQSRTR